MAASKYYQTTHWRELRIQAIRRDSWRCQDCGVKVLGKKRGGPDAASPVVDHIEARPRFLDVESAWDVLANLKTLCNGCHSKKTAWEDKKGVGVRADGLPDDGSWD